MTDEERRIIALQIKRDICNLVEIAIRLSENQAQRDQIKEKEQEIHAGLADYEQAWRAKFERVEHG